MKKLTSLTRTELTNLAEVKKVDISNAETKGEVLAALIAKLGPDFEVKEVDMPEKPMKDRILELAAEKKTTPQIQRKMRSEGYHRIRAGYIYTILRQEGISVPKSERVVLSKDEYEELLKAAGHKK